MAESLLRLLGARMLGSLLAWGTAAGGLSLLAGIGLAVVLGRTRALRVTFPGARFARGVVYVWTALVCAAGGGVLGGLHGAVRGFGDAVDDPSFTASTLRPAAAPVADGLVHAVAVQASMDAAPMLAGAAPIPVGPLRAVLTDTTGTALFAGLRRVPALQSSEAGRGGSLLLTALASAVASGKVDAAFESLGLRGPLSDLAAALPADPTAMIGHDALVALVEQHFLPGVVRSTVAIGERQLLVSGALGMLGALLAPIALVWLIEGLVRLARSRRLVAAPSSSPTPTPPA